MPRHAAARALGFSVRRSACDCMMTVGTFRIHRPPLSRRRAGGDFWSLRVVDERNQHLAVRRNVVQPVRASDDLGAMITVVDGGGMGYARDLRPDRSRPAPRRGRGARLGARRPPAARVLSTRRSCRASASGRVRLARSHRRGSRSPLADKIDLLRARVRAPEAAIRASSTGRRRCGTPTLRDAASSPATAAGRSSSFRYLLPTLSATANAGGRDADAHLRRPRLCRQGGLEVLDEVGFHDAAPRVAAQALELLTAPDCPSGTHGPASSPPTR